MSLPASKRKHCQWPGMEHPLYTRYHDTEWGVPKRTDKELFEKLILEGFQAGLSWLTILKKRDGFRAAFRDFDPERVAQFTRRDIERCMKDKAIIRNQLKIEATVANAKAYLHLRERTTLAHWLWEFIDGSPIINRYKKMSDLPAKTKLSEEISKALKKEGFRFVGPTTIYAFMQSVGMVNDHLVTCHRHAPCTKLLKNYRPPVN